MKEFIAYTMIKDLSKVTKEHAKLFTRMNLAFSKLKDNRAYIPDLEDMKYLETLRSYNPKMKIVLSIGGAGAFGFSDMAMTSENRKVFLESMVFLVKQYNLDGIDLDWEFPCADWGGDYSPKDKENFTTLLGEMREALDTSFEDHKLLTIAAGVGQWFIDTTEVSKYHQYLDDIMLMTYDLRGFGQEITGHHTTLFTKKDDVFKMSAKDGVDLLVEQGVPKEKIVIGFAQYSRHWKDVESHNNGLLQKAAPKGGDYRYEYPELLDKVINNPDFTVYWDDEAKVPWAYSHTLKEFETFDNKRSVQEKWNFVNSYNLKGLMFWRYCDWPENDMFDFIKE